MDSPATRNGFGRREPRSDRRLLRTLAFAASLVALGCGPGAQESPAPNETNESDAVVARVDGEPIRESELDAPLRLALHDLARAGYELRRKRLRELISNRLGGEAPPNGGDGRSEILLAPPEPPQLDIDLAGAPIRGPQQAPVTIVEFLDFESTHCGRMQPILRRILADYGDSVRLALRNLPLPFHRNARNAALAAACAGEQAAFWDYHDVLLQQQSDLSLPALRRYAGRLGLDRARFERCLEAEHPAPQLAADARRASALGVRTAPTFFVNGRYLKGPQSYEGLARAIDRELGVPPARPAESRASQLEFATRTGELPEADEILASLPEPDAILSLRRAQIDAALLERDALARRLSFAPGSHDGRRLLRVAEIRPGDLFDLLGLHVGDVLVLIDGAFISDLENPMWQALAERSEVTLAVFSGGRRQIYRYAIE